MVGARLRVDGKPLPPCSRDTGAKPGKGHDLVPGFGEKQAEKIIAAGLEVFGLEEAQLPGMKESADKKVLIAAIVREMTAVKVAWLAERLEMGSKSNVTRASSTVLTRQGADKTLRRTRKKIHATMSS
jgi:hypothetical protein